jgi:hypothetical protein
LLDAVQVQPNALAVKPSVIVPPSAADERLAEVSENVHAPPSVMVNGFPIMLSKTEREFRSALGSTVKFTVPLPDPEAPDVTLIAQGLLLTTVQGQPGEVVTFTCSGPPLALREAELELSE